MIRDYELGAKLVEYVNVDPNEVYATYDENSKIVAIFVYVKPRLQVITGWTIQECQRAIMLRCNHIDDEISEEMMGN